MRRASGSSETYRWEEILEGLCVDEGEVHAAEHPGEGVFDGFLESIPGASDLFLLAAVGQQYTVLRNFPLFLRQPASVLGPIGKEEERYDADEDTGGTLDDEEPLPADSEDCQHQVMIYRTAELPHL